MKTNRLGPAFEGKTLRDEFAMAALQGWIAGVVNELDGYEDEEEAFAEHQALVAKAAYGYADAMLAERAKK